MPNIAESLETASRELASANIPEPRREAVSLLCFAIGRDRTFLIAHTEYELTGDENEQFRAIIARRAARVPFHHITGIKEFYGLDFMVTPDVLIPRPETEMLVAKSIDILREADSPKFCEVGIGSGCIAVSVLYNIEAASALGIDISEPAIDVARQNAERNGVLSRLELLNSNLFSGLDDQLFDLIVSNPPYIPAEDIDALEPEVRDFEPRHALTDGADGLSIIESIIRGSPSFLLPGGSLLLEIGIGQAERAAAMFDSGTWASVEAHDDFQGIPRMVHAVLKSA